MNDIIETRVFQERWLKDGIGEDYKLWMPHGEVSRRRPTRVFIESPSGTGKTSFVFDPLLPHAAAKGRSILYLGVRASLDGQTERARSLGWKQKAVQTGGGAVFSCPDSPAVITLLSYQEVLAFGGTLSSYAYIVFDDVHCLVEDSLFNAHTGSVLQKILTGAPDAAWIFLSSSMESVSAVLHRWTDRILPSNYADNDLSRKLLQQHCLTYRNELRRSAYRPVFFRGEAALLRAVSQTPKEEKWLIFVSSVQQGKELQRRTGTAAGRSAAFFSSQNKTGKRWSQLLQEQRFPQDVLITTRVLGSGGAVCDRSVRHIALPFCGKTEFLQMLGRCRLGPDDTVQLCIEVPAIQKINTLLALVRRKTVAIERTRRCPPREKTALLQQMWEEGRQEINSLFYISRSGELTVNELAEEKLRQLEAFYSNLAGRYRESGCYERQVLSWLGLDGEAPRYLGEVAPDGLPGFLAHCAGRRCEPEDCESFYQEFQRLFAQECFARFGADSPQASAARAIRKGTTQRKATVNRQLRLLALPYELKKERNGWVLHAVPCGGDASDK